MRRMLGALGVVVVVAWAGVAAGQPVSGKVKFEVSADGGATWGATASVAAGDPYRVRAVASWVDGVQPAYGLSIITLEEIRFQGATQAEFTGFADLYKFFPVDHSLPENWALYDITGGVKIDNVKPPATYKLNFGQDPKINPATGAVSEVFTQANPLRIFEIEMTSRAGETYGVTIDASYLRSGTPVRNNFMVYMTEHAGQRRYPAQEATLESAFVTVHLPAPGTVAITGMGLVSLARRHRA